jgi:hypothetical protein
MPLSGSNNNSEPSTSSSTDKKSMALAQTLATNYEYTTTNIPAFLSKLWTLVEDPKYNELIAWDQVNFKNTKTTFFFFVIQILIFKIRLVSAFASLTRTASHTKYCPTSLSTIIWHRSYVNLTCTDSER